MVFRTRASRVGYADAQEAEPTGCGAQVDQFRGGSVICGDHLFLRAPFGLKRELGQAPFYRRNRDAQASFGMLGRGKRQVVGFKAGLDRLATVGAEVVVKYEQRVAVSKAAHAVDLTEEVGVDRLKAIPLLSRKTKHPYMLQVDQL